MSARFQFLGDADGCNHQITWYKRLKKHWTIAIPAPYHSTTQKWSPQNQGKGDKGAHKPKNETIRAYTSFFSMKHARSIATPQWTGCQSIAGLSPSSMSPVPIYTNEWRETKWGKVPCLTKQRDGRGLAPDLQEFEVLTINRSAYTPPHSATLRNTLKDHVGLNKKFIS